ncbi:MAG TPA: malto-oligosyltrehalose synthase [Nocardioides sp.]|uniref:malto-oligosyltrehalose synthase n=1 Tax=Nocardioides sp. TaxID=35761 RepID=UPI002CEEC4EE|nr:malto-oligosyltrehalose synthase [Nocardioides sp.]HQR25993.1 malto-oligosyltrehalose synthase [Nocardioides sp.]
MTPLPGRVPRSTYRLQITEEFDLLAAAGVLPYLHDLGVDWVYLSPILAAEADSEHGYDVADHSRIDPARGGVAGLAAVAAEARRLGMGVLVDIVPNHVGVANPAGNSWWWSVLTYGPASPYADAFDIDWAAGGGRLRIPVVAEADQAGLGGPIAHLRVEAGQLRYHDQAYPLAPGTADDWGDPGVDADTVHGRQHYELVGWRLADAGLNYRRFFAVSSLAAIRVEDPQWFTKTHAVIGEWFTDGAVDGLRVDHPDGLRDPGGYLDDLAALTDGAYVLVEKILETGERLPQDWATAGTTGYDVLGLVDRVLTDPAGEAPLTAYEERLRGRPVDWPDLVHDNKRAVCDTILRSEVLRLGRELRVALPDAPADTEDAVAELLACFPVYRSYLPEGREHLDEALAEARRRRPELGATLDLLAPVLADPASDPALRFQQTSGMVMAKGVEDRSFYQWARLTSLNEVGGDPAVFSVSVDAFHEAMAERQQDWPAAMTTLTTHDTKRGEDVRARIAALAELPAVWAQTLDSLLARTPVPDSGLGNLLWQAVVGAWPSAGGAEDLRERLQGYAEKAMREAGEHTTWTDPDEEFERAVHAAVDACFDDAETQSLLAGLLDQLSGPGWSNALAAKLVALTVPGVPDVYQGSELWQQSLVDPDNRRPVDFEARASRLADLEAGARPRLSGAGVDDPGTVKLLVTSAALRLRRDRPELFTGYGPLAAAGDAAAHVLAFDRGGAVTVVTRLPVGLAARGGWGGTTLALPAGEWVDVLSGRTVAGGDVPLATLLSEHPVALLARVPAEEPVPPRRGRFDVWAPRPHRVGLRVGDRVVPMERGADDWWRPTGPVPDGEVDYGYLLDDDPTPRPDPRSRRQPGGVHGLSRTFDASAYAWRDATWTGRQLAGSVIYELHVGTFTPEGTFDAALARLDHLRELGVDLVEVMPVNAVPGVHNWGYDGVLWSTVHEPYGGPEAYQRFVDGCHAAGLGVVQDVVYNHLGPSGNYLPLFGPYVTEEPGRLWGPQVNLDGEGSAEVRRLVLDNVRMWFEDFHVDGLRLDAVHALSDESAVHLLEEMAVEVAALSAHHRRPMTLIAESDLNDARLVAPREAGGYGLDAQWDDDFHHALHVALTGETGGYYADFAPLGALAKVFGSGFFHDGTWSSFRGRPHGAPLDTERVPGWRLVVCSQNHDQVGNRARGDRLTEQLDSDQLVCAAMLTLLSPFTPMLFQGEEWAASAPFPFFTSHPEPALGAAVAQGRLEEFEQMGWNPADVPDPQDPATYAAATLDWGELSTGRHAVVLEVYRRLLRLRRSRREVTDPDLRGVSCTADEERRLLTLRRAGLLVAVNFGDREARVDLGRAGLELLFTTPTPARLEGVGLVLPPHAGAVVAPG